MIIRRVITLTCLFLFSKFAQAEVDQDELFGKATGGNEVKGTKAHLGEYPFSVIFYENSIKQVKTGYYMTPICSGTVVSGRWILTTAKPLGLYKMDTYFMMAGLHIIPHAPEKVFNRTINIYHIEVMVVHPDWHEYSYNDLGMARTDKELRFGKELGVIKIPSYFTPPDDNNTICSMNIWASHSRVQHLLGHYQTTYISKQTIEFRVANGLKFCPDTIFTNKTLCVMQVNPNGRKDVCTVNSGAIISCNCQAVGLFTGINGDVACVNTPPLQYTALNLVKYIDWIRMIVNVPTPHPHTIHTISESSFIHVNAKFNIFIIYKCFSILLIILKVEY